MSITISGNTFYYIFAPIAILYLFWESWLCLVRKKKHLTVLARFQLWLAEKSQGSDLVNRKKIELTSDKHIRAMGIEALLAGLILLLTFLMKLRS